MGVRPQATYHNFRRIRGRRLRSSKTRNPALLVRSQSTTRRIDDNPASIQCTASRVLDKTKRWK